MTDLPRSPPVNVNRRIAQGVVWQTAARFSVRVLGLVGTLVLARLLTPADFGLIAVAMAIVSLLELFADCGFSAALIRHPRLTVDHVNTAWCIAWQAPN